MKFRRSRSPHTQTAEADRSGSTRREFLGRVSAGAAGAAVLGTLGGMQAVAADEVVASTSPLQFGRLFPKLPPFAPGPILTSTKLNDALVAMSKPGGVLDAQDDLSKGPILLITDPTLSLNNPNNPTHTAGTTFMGQFMDHDVTFDIGSPLGIPTAPESSTNGRTPAFDLDSVYGLGPTGSPLLYNPGDPAKLRIESGGLFEDVPRAADNSAIIADPRNDENIIIAGLQCAFILFHNHAVDVVRAQGPISDAQAFVAARRLTTWHYHWMIVHEFLPLFIGQATVDAILSQGRRFYTPPVGQAFIPVEFQGAAYRFGHSMVRPSYRANFTGMNGNPFFGFIFDPVAEQANPSDPDDLSGNARAPRRFVGWHTFFDFGEPVPVVRPNKMIDRRLSTPLFNLPLQAIASHAPPLVLPLRTLLRHITWSLPSGQSIASAIGAHRLTPSDLNELKDYGLDLNKNTPLFYYVLAEAELMENGLHLGPVGGTIVGEVILGLLQTDPASYLVQQPSWTPTLPAAYSNDGGFRMIDFLAFAGVDAQR